ARSRTSGEYFFDVLFMAPFSQDSEPPEIPARFTSWLRSLKIRSLRKSRRGSPRPFEQLYRIPLASEPVEISLPGLG
ncbi:hypothetical protein, partial [Sinorhizobium meliloti]|uniref:hypothetical protein n=1 Tax=Rhizobium meliloti TaxID=382 RepID=UPI001AECB42B